MRTARRITAVAAIGVFGALSGNAFAADVPFGQHVSTCAHELGNRADAPAVTCTHQGTTMTFENFGAMVLHMRAH